MGATAQVDRPITVRPAPDVKGSQGDRSDPVQLNSGVARAPSGNATIFDQVTVTGSTVSALRHLLQLEFARETGARVLPKEPRGSARVLVLLSHQIAFVGTQFWNWARTAVAEWRSRVRLRREVSSLNDRELWDVGLTRADVMNQTHKLF